MKKTILPLFMLAFALSLQAQSSGSFNFNADQTACTDVGGLLGDGSSHTSLKTTLKVSSGNGNALVIRPSAVTGLLTNLSLSGKFGDAIASVYLDKGQAVAHVEAAKLHEVLKELRDGEDFNYFEDRRADHSERAWAKRAPAVLEFLFPPPELSALNGS